MNILITGFSGFLGRPLSDTLYKQGHSILGISRHKIITPLSNPLYEFPYLNVPFKQYNCDLTGIPLNTLKQVITNFKPDIIIHLAGNAMVKDYDHTVSLNNIIPIHKILEVIPKQTQLIFASSTTVYGTHTTPRFITDQPRPDSIYAETKLYCEKLIEKYHSTYKKLDRYKILRLCAHIAPQTISTHGLVRDIVSKLQSSSKHLELFSNSMKPFLWIDDSIKAIIESIDLEYNGIYNVSPDDNLSVEEIARMIMDGLNIQKPIKWVDGNWKGDTGYVSIKSDFPWIRSSKEAIQSYIDSI